MIPMMQNQMEKNMEHETETGALARVPNGPAV